MLASSLMRALITSRAAPLTRLRSVGAGKYVPDVMRIVALLTATAFVGAFVIAAGFRLSYPFALVLGEEYSVGEVDRVVHGQLLYVERTLQHVPLIYGPILSL